MSRPSDLVQGTRDLLILKILALEPLHLWVEPLHGWAIAQRLRQVSGDVLQVSEGSLYPALHKLENEGWISSEWKPSENNRRAKFYALTRPGRQQLEKERSNWDRLSVASPPWSPGGDLTGPSSTRESRSICAYDAAPEDFSLRNDTHGSGGICRGRYGVPVRRRAGLIPAYRATVDSIGALRHE